MRRRKRLSDVAVIQQHVRPAEKKPHWVTPARMLRKGRLAARLVDLADGYLILRYSPAEHPSDDQDAQGHLFIGGYFAPLESPMHGAELVTLDDRSPVPMAEQLQLELRRIAAVYVDLAETVARNVAIMAKGGAA
jgi:hypothetical protein